MITIFVVFSLITFFEWHYLKRNKRSVRAFLRVIATACFLLVAMEAIYLLKDRWTVAAFIASIFGPIQQLLFVKT